MSEDYNFFTTIVAGENPKELMKEYDKKIKVTPYVLYESKDAHKLKVLYIDSCKDELNSDDLTSFDIDEINDELDYVKNLSDEDFFEYFTAQYDKDKEGNAISDKNKKGKWSFYQEGKLFSVPFITYDGKEVFQAHKKDIDWFKIHLSGQEIYRRAWEMVMENDTPKTEYEKTIYENMKNRTGYFQKFGDKEKYVVHSTAFWGYAFLDENKWIDMDSANNEFEWVSDFFERFIVPLDENTLLTIFECRK